MRSKQKSLFYMLFFSALILLLFLVMQPLQVLHFQNYIAVLFPKGIIALEERNLLYLLQILMLIVVIPVYLLTFIFSWKYRAENKNATYQPELTHNWIAECFWWGIPLVMTLIAGTITWIKTYELDPYKPLVSSKAPINIQAVALQWKWLFIYPDENIASLNFIQIPENTPIHFEVTADAPMNSLWIPHLGGQIYAMPAMRTELNLIANEKGDFRGSSANISGEGFSGMHFITRASSEEDYQKWITAAKQSPHLLDFETYAPLSLPSQNNPVELYQLKSDLFNQIIMKYGH